MEGLVVLVLLVLAAPVALVVALVVLFSRVADLRRRLEVAEAALRAAPVPAPVPPEASSEVAGPVSATVTPEPTPVAEQPVLAGPPPVLATVVPPVAPRPPPVPAGRDTTGRLAEWLGENWVYVVSGVSLALAGVFLVQYGMENGWLPPVLRVLFALAFGAGLIAAGEVIRRRYGDSEGVATAYLPSVLAAAGVVSVFAALLSARFLYGLIGAELTFAALVATALGAMVLGWLMGPLLAAMGLVGAAAAPFLTGGGAEAPDWLVAHYLLVAASGLGIDTLRRWGWVSVLALALAYAGGWLLTLAGVSQAAFALMCVALVPLAIAIPARGLVPDQDGPSMIEVALGRGRTSPFPLLLAAGTVVATALLLVTQTGRDAGTVQIGFLLLAGLALLLLVWPDRAPALHELALVPAAGFLLKLVAEATSFGPLWSAYDAAALDRRLPETAAPATVTLLAALAALVAAGLVWRARRGTLFAPVLAGAGAGAVLLAGMALLAEWFWTPSAVQGGFGWALHVIALAAVATGLALSFGQRADRDARRALAYLALAALVLVALALFAVTSKATLTVALSVLVLVAAGLDRRFDLPEMGWAVQAGLAVIFYRLVVDPGLFWATEAPLPAAILSHVAPAAASVAGLSLIRGLPRPATRAAMEAGAAIAPALLVDALLLRYLPEGASHWRSVLLGLPWLLVMLGQVWRAAPGLPGRELRLVLAVIAAVPATMAMAVAMGIENPLLTPDPVLGPPVLNTLALTYALPGLLLLAARRRIGWLPPAARLGFLATGSALLAVYAALAIRHLWQGPDLSMPGVAQGELYAYTLALILLGAGLLWQAIARGSPVLRRAAMGVIGLAAAKVFLVDISGLAGLMRVFSFLALGLSLAGLAWLNRWASMRSAPSGPSPAAPL